MPTCHFVSPDVCVTVCVRSYIHLGMSVRLWLCALHIVRACVIVRVCVRMCAVGRVVGLIIIANISALAQ